MAWPETTAVLDALEAEGGADCVRFVGGAVRNAVMGLPVAEVDLATTLSPDRSAAALRSAGIRVVPTGIEHGTVTAVVSGRPFEITTLRKDVSTDGRNATVAFTTDWREDAERRDFRLNALYADRSGTVFEPVPGSLEDARRGRIVFVGNAETRIREDYLRVLRFFRFHAWYGRGEPDAAALSACAAMRGGLVRLSAERVAKELLKLLEAPDPRDALRLMRDASVLDHVLSGDLRIARFEAAVPIDPDPIARLSALLPDDPDERRSTAARLRLSNAHRDRLVAAVEGGPEVRIDLSDRQARAALYRLGESAFTDRVLLRQAESGDTVGGDRLRALARAWSPPQFPLGGQDLAALGVAQGPRVGRLLRAVEDWWVEADFPATGVREKLVELASDG